jgi:DNA helicase-2/ATP-dependent DNA helicase PcrA
MTYKTSTRRPARRRRTVATKPATRQTNPNLPAPNKYGAAILSAIENGSQNLIVTARAGSGKTTLLLQIIAALPATARVLLAAFNKHIATELQGKVPAHCEAATLHSIGFRAHRNAFGPRIKVESGKTYWILKDYNGETEKGKELTKKVQSCVKRLVSLAKANMIMTGDELVAKMGDLIGYYGVDLPTDVGMDELQPILRGVYNKSIEDTATVDFDDMIFLPLAHGVAMPTYGFVLIDESQDLNPMQIELVCRLSQAGRVVMVGDDKQAIYGFRGADTKAIESLKNRLSADIMPLSICYRCDSAIIAEAQRIVSDIEAAPSAATGSVTTISDMDFEESVKDGDMVLCRVNAPLVMNCLRMIRQGRKATIIGRDFSKNLVSTLRKIAKKYGETDLQESIENHRAAEMAKFEKRWNKGGNEAVNFADTMDTLQVILHESKAQTVEGCKATIERIFDQPNAAVTFSSVHRSKGLESYRVFILNPELMPHPMAKSDWEREQEQNLIYVAVTRAKHELVWVKTSGEAKPKTRKGKEETEQ